MTITLKHRGSSISIYHDLLLTRHYVYNSELNSYGIVAVVEGVIRGFFRVNDTVLLFDLRQLKNTEEAEPYLQFVERTLPKPEIAYGNAPHAQGLIARIQNINEPGSAVPVGLIGEVLKEAPIRPQNIFQIAKDLSQASPQLPGGGLIFSRDPSGKLLYIGASHLRLAGADKTRTFYSDGSYHELPVQGAAVLEQIILDTQSAENLALLNQLKAKMPLLLPDTGRFY